jgi:S-adenosylmethionine decarboxylase
MDFTSNSSSHNERRDSVGSAQSDDGSLHGTTASNSSVDSETHATPEYVPGTFEGPEKNMEVVFKVDKGVPDGLRTLSREQLDTLCTKAKCTILSKISNSYMDAYVLSESSLFVYKHRYIMKTCGTTTLLRCLSTLLEYSDKLGMELDWVGYSRKNLLFPNAQLWPHSNFGEEINYIKSHAKLQDRLKGSGYILGPITDDHWFVYVADHSSWTGHRLSSPGKNESDKMVTGVPRLHSSMSSQSLVGLPSTERTVNMMMFDMAPEVADIFFKENTASGKEMTLKSGINNLCPGATIDETAFTPCGYSMNAILHDAYFTVHITPEKECSYCSFETNTSLKSYASMVRNVLNVFRPKRFVLTMFGDEAAISSIPELPTDPRNINIPGFGSFVRTSLASTKVETELCCLMACYSYDNYAAEDTVVMEKRERGLSVV